MPRFVYPVIAIHQQCAELKGGSPGLVLVSSDAPREPYSTARKNPAQDHGVSLKSIGPAAGRLPDVESGDGHPLRLRHACRGGQLAVAPLGTHEMGVCSHSAKPAV